MNKNNIHKIVLPHLNVAWTDTHYYYTSIT